MKVIQKIYQWFKKTNFIPYLLILFFILILSFLIFNYEINISELKNILDNLITVTGIFSAIILSFLSIKLFQIKEKKEKLFGELNDLSRKLMFFKKVCYTINYSFR